VAPGTEPATPKPKFAVTTSHRPHPGQLESAKKLAAEFEAPYADRNDLSLEALSIRLQVDGMVVVSAKKVAYVSGGGEFFFHPGLAGLRIMEVKNGKTDQMIKAMSLQKGESLLDCTLGLGTDAILASFVTGPEGRVTGLESSLLIATLVRHGLSVYSAAEVDTVRAMRRVEVVNADYKEYLAGLPPRSYDVVYFDPMFRAPRFHSPAMNALRALANPEPVDRETIDLALRAAVKKVVLKERRGSAEFERLGFKKICGGRYSPVVYGVMDLQGAPDEK